MTDNAFSSQTKATNNLIECPDCRKIISINARSCPFCGAPSRYDEYDRGVFKNWTEYEMHLPPKCHLEARNIKAEARYWTNILQRDFNISYENEEMAVFVQSFWEGFIHHVFPELPFINQELAAKMLREGVEEIEKQWQQERSIPRCPRCGSKKIGKLSQTRRAVSIALWGMFSQDINKSMTCYNCNYKW